MKDLIDLLDVGVANGEGTPIGEIQGPSLDSESIDTIGQARMHLAQSVTRSSAGEDVEARRHIRESMQLLDCLLEEAEYGE